MLYNKPITISNRRIRIMKDVDKNVIDLGAIGVTTGALFEILPSITALASLIWVLLRIYETETVQKLLKKQ